MQRLLSAHQQNDDDDHYQKNRSSTDVHLCSPLILSAGLHANAVPQRESYVHGADEPGDAEDAPEEHRAGARTGGAADEQTEPRPICASVRS